MLKDKDIKSGIEYEILGNSEYFLKKYGTSNPIIKVELPDNECWLGGWKNAIGIPAALLFAMRTGFEGPHEFGMVMLKEWVS